MHTPAFFPQHHCDPTVSVSGGQIDDSPDKDEAHLPAYDEFDAASSGTDRALDTLEVLRCDRGPESDARAPPSDDASSDSEVSRGCPAQDGLVQFRFGHQLLQTSILPIQLF